MKQVKKIISICAAIIIGMPLIAFATTAFNSAQVGSGPINGYVLQTNGSTSTWVPSSGGGSTGTVSTSSVPVVGNVSYWTSSFPALLGNVATGTISQGTGISISGTPYSLHTGTTITNTGVTSIIAGSNITVSGATGAVTVNSTASGGQWASTTNPRGIYPSAGSTTQVLVGEISTSTVANLEINGQGVPVSLGGVGQGGSINVVGDGGGSLPLQLNGFGSGYAVQQWSTSNNDIEQTQFINRSSGSSAVGCHFFDNDKTTLNGTGVASSYYGGICFAGSNYNLPGFNGLKPNGVGVFALDGPLTLGSGSFNPASSTIYFQAGSGLDAVADMVLTGVTSRLGIGTSTPAGKTIVVPVGNVGDIGFGVYDPLLNDYEFEVIKVSSSGYRIAARGLSTIPQADAAGFSILTSANAAQFLDANCIFLAASYANATCQTGQISSDVASDLKFGVDGSTKALINGTTGNFGIATSTPYATLSVQSNLSTGDAFVVATSSGNPIVGFDNDGHKFTSGPKPTISTCGTGTGTVNGDDEGGTITTATAATACTMTFAKSYRGNGLYCMVTDDSLTGIADITSTSTTAVVFGISSALTGGHLYYQCAYHK